MHLDALVLPCIHVYDSSVRSKWYYLPSKYWHAFQALRRNLVPKPLDQCTECPAPKCHHWRHKYGVLFLHQMFLKMMTAGLWTGRESTVLYFFCPGVSFIRSALTHSGWKCIRNVFSRMSGVDGAGCWAVIDSIKMYSVLYGSVSLYTLLQLKYVPTVARTVLAMSSIRWNAISCQSSVEKR